LWPGFAKSILDKGAQGYVEANSRYSSRKRRHHVLCGRTVVVGTMFRIVPSRMLAPLEVNASIAEARRRFLAFPFSLFPCPYLRRRIRRHSFMFAQKSPYAYQPRSSSLFLNFLLGFLLIFMVTFFIWVALTCLAPLPSLSLPLTSFIRSSLLRRSLSFRLLLSRSSLPPSRSSLSAPSFAELLLASCWLPGLRSPRRRL
jgi:hypothetical protein